MARTIAAAELDSAFDALDVHPDQGERLEVDPLYSGRGMFGETCLAVILDRVTDLGDLGGLLGLGRPSVDSLGQSAVGYWPGVTLEGISRHQACTDCGKPVDWFGPSENSTTCQTCTTLPVTCDNCDARSEAGWGDTALCIDCQREEDPDLVCEEHLLTHNEGEACPACKALVDARPASMAGAIVETTTDDEGETVYFT